MDEGRDPLKLDEFRLCVRPGHGLVARFPASILVVTAPDWAGHARGRPASRGVPSGRAGSPLAARLANLIDDTGSQKVPAFCAIAEEDDGLAMFVHGDSQVVITGAQPVMRLSGHGSAGWTSGIHDRWRRWPSRRPAVRLNPRPATSMSTSATASSPVPGSCCWHATL